MRTPAEIFLGQIINISSIRGIDHCGREGIMDYSAAKAILFLASDDANFFTGQLLLVDGGFSLK